MSVELASPHVSHHLVNPKEYELQHKCQLIVGSFVENAEAMEELVLKNDEFSVENGRLLLSFHYATSRYWDAVAEFLA